MLDVRSSSWAKFTTPIESGLNIQHHCPTFFILERRKAAADPQASITTLHGETRSENQRNHQGPGIQFTPRHLTSSFEPGLYDGTGIFNELKSSFLTIFDITVFRLQKDVAVRFPPCLEWGSLELLGWLRILCPCPWRRPPFDKRAPSKTPCPENQDPSATTGDSPPPPLP